MFLLHSGNNYRVKTSYIYNTSTNLLKRVGDLSTVRYGHVLVRSDDGDVYAIGGDDANDDCLDTIEKFDRNTRAWSVVGSKLNYPRSHFQAVAYESFIYVISGQLQHKNVARSIEKFDTRTGKVRVNLLVCKPLKRFILNQKLQNKNA